MSSREVLAVLDDPRFAPLFAPGSRAEVPIVGRLARPGRTPILVSGQVDRLVVTPTAVLIADYKTNRPAPRSLAEVERARRLRRASSRSTAPCWRKLYPGPADPRRPGLDRRA